MKKTITSAFAVLICFIILLSIVTYPLEANYACDKGMVKCLIAAMLSGGLMPAVGAFCAAGYAVCVQYYEG